MIRNRKLEEAYRKVASQQTSEVEVELSKTVKVKDEDYRTIMEAYTNVNEADYKKNTLKFIDDLLKGDDVEKVKDFLQGIRDYLDENGYLSPGQQAALGKIKGNLNHGAGK